MGFSYIGLSDQMNPDHVSIIPVENVEPSITKGNGKASLPFVIEGFTFSNRKCKYMVCNIHLKI